MASSMLHTIIKVVQLVLACLTLGFTFAFLKTTSDPFGRRVVNWSEVALILVAPGCLVSLSLYLIIGYAMRNVKPTMQEVFVTFLALLLLVGNAGVTMNLVLYPCWHVVEQQQQLQRRRMVGRDLGGVTGKSMPGGHRTTRQARILPPPKPTHRVCLSSQEKKFATITCVVALLTMMSILVDGLIVCISTNTTDFNPKRNKRLSQGMQTAAFAEHEERLDPDDESPEDVEALRARL